jgi:hypothetical protein
MIHMAAAPVFRLRPRTRRQVELLQETLDLGGWSQAAQVEINSRLILRTETSEPWCFAMIASRAETVSALLHEIGAGPRSFSTLAVWYALAPYVRRDTGEIVCSQRTLAKTSGVAIGDVSRALVRLVEIGALIQEGRGRYSVHPSLMWKGELTKRERAEVVSPPLSLVGGGKKPDLVE